MSEKVRVRCGAENCGVAFDVDKEAIQHDKYIECYCGWQGNNPHFIGEVMESSPLVKNKLRTGLRESDNPISKQLRGVVFKLMVSKKWKRVRVARKMGFKSIHYLSMLLNNFDKWWPKTKPAQNRILEKIKKGEELIGEPNLNKGFLDGKEIEDLENKKGDENV